MQNTELKGRNLLKVTGIVFIALSVLGLLANLVLIAAGLASGAEGGMAWGLLVAIMTLGVLAVPISVFGLVSGILGVKWCARPDKAQVLFVLGVVLAAGAALNLLIDLGSGGISSSAGDVVRLSLAVLYTLGAWRFNKTAAGRGRMPRPLLRFLCKFRARPGEQLQNREEKQTMGLGKKTVEEMDVRGKRVLVRCDFNVPMKDGKITNDNRIVAALPTIKKLIENGGKVILCSHLGKPKNGPEEKFSLAPVAVRLSELLGKNVVFANDDTVVGENAKAAVAAMNDGDVVLLQNTRFRKEETKNLPEFSQDLASIADCYVNDAFGSAHRAHCSTAGVTDYVKDTAVGYLMEKEIRYLGNAVNDPERPFTAILGGAKVADKLNVIANLLEKVDTLIIGGGMAYTFLVAKGYGVGTSLVDEEKVEYCKEMMAKAEAKGVKLLLPVDTVITASFPDPIDGPVDVQVVPSDSIPADMMGLDIGPKTRELFAEAVKASKTVVWNGPMGVFENPTLAAGTLAVAKAMAEADATTVIGGGDSAAAVMQLGYADKMTHISTGGGASLEYLEGKELPGIACIQNA